MDIFGCTLSLWPVSHNFQKPLTNQLENTHFSLTGYQAMAHQSLGLTEATVAWYEHRLPCQHQLESTLFWIHLYTGSWPFGIDFIQGFSLLFSYRGKGNNNPFFHKWSCFDSVCIETVHTNIQKQRVGEKERGSCWPKSMPSVELFTGIKKSSKQKQTKNSIWWPVILVLSPQKP